MESRLQKASYQLAKTASNDSVILERMPLRERIFHYLREQIVSGQLQPGQRVKEKEIAEQLRVSTTPVREAILLLSQKSYLRLDHNRGAEVAPFSAEEFRSICPIVGALAGLAAQQAIPLSPKELDALRRMNRQLRDYADSDDRASFHRLHLNFHESYVLQISNQILIDLFRDLRGRMYERYGFLALEKSGRMREIVREHRTIISAFQEEDLVRVDQSIRSHLQRSGSILETLLSEPAAREAKKAGDTRP